MLHLDQDTLLAGVLLNLYWQDFMYDLLAWPTRYWGSRKWLTHLQTPNHRLQTPNPRPQTLDPKTQTPNPKPQTLDPKS